MTGWVAAVQTEFDQGRMWRAVRAVAVAGWSKTLWARNQCVCTFSHTNTLSNVSLIPLRSHRSPRSQSAACRIACRSSRRAGCQSGWSWRENKENTFKWVKLGERYHFYACGAWLCVCASACDTHQVWALGRLLAFASIWWMVKSLGPAAPADKTQTACISCSSASNPTVHLPTSNWSDKHWHFLQGQFSLCSLSQMAAFLGRKYAPKMNCGLRLVTFKLNIKT